MEDGEGTLERPAAPKIVFDDVLMITFGGGVHFFLGLARSNI